MYGKGAGTLSAASGISLLPNTGNSHPLFIIAAGLLVSGIVVFVISFVLSRKHRHTEAN